MKRWMKAASAAVCVSLLRGPPLQADDFVFRAGAKGDGLAITDPQAVIMAGAYEGSPEDSPELRIDPNTTDSPWAGVGAIGICGVFNATGVPISSRHVLTAGHALDLDNDGQADVAPCDVAFHLNYGGNSTHIIGATELAIHPHFTGFNHPALNDDIGVVTLATDIPANVPVYPLCKRPMQQGDILTLVGYGRSGYGDWGFSLPLENFNLKRAGQNVADLSFLDDENRNFPEVYVFDFDGPDESTNMLRGPTLGNNLETTLGFGDSGGPAFIWDAGQYKVAGINTFIARFTGQPFMPPLFGSAGGGIMVFPMGQWIAGQCGLTWDVNILALDVQGTPAFLQPGHSVLIDMNALNLAQRVHGVQAFLNFSSAHFSTEPGAVNVAAGGGDWDQLIFSMFTVEGDLDIAVGVDMETATGTDTDATVAIITLTAAGEGTTQLVFRPDADPDPGLVQTTMFSDENSLTVMPVKVDSQLIVIDGTAPDPFAVAADPLCTNGSTELAFSTTDSLAGIDSYELFVEGVSYGTVTSPHMLDLSDDTYPDGEYQIVVRAQDKAGNHTDSSPVTIVVDKTPPVIGSVMAEQRGASVLCPDVAVQGVVDIYVDVVDDGCAGLVIPPEVTVDGISPVNYVGASGNTYHYQVTVLPTTENAEHIVVVHAEDDLGNDAVEAGARLCVNKNQVQGTIEFDTLEGTHVFDRDVVFKATCESGTVLRTWIETVAFASVDPDGDAGNRNNVAAGFYTLTGVPQATVGLSAKTAWSLREKQSVLLDGSGQATIDFSGDRKLRGGDIDDSNSINILDYSVLRVNWFSGHMVADVNGDGQVQLLDYAILKSCWFQVGAPE